MEMEKLKEMLLFDMNYWLDAAIEYLEKYGRGDSLVHFFLGRAEQCFDILTKVIR
jgi:hypothetical protein